MMNDGVSPNRKRQIEDSREPVSLEGNLLCRMGKSSGHSGLLWKRRFVYFSFANGGSITVYKESPNFDIDKLALDNSSSKNTGVLQKFYRKLSRNASSRNDGIPIGHELVDFDITADLPWIAKDVERDSSAFVIEIATVRQRVRSSSLSDDGEESGTSTPGTGIEVAIIEEDDDHDFDLFDTANHGAGSAEENLSTTMEKLRTRLDSVPETNFSFDENEKVEASSLVGNDCNFYLSREIECAKRKGKPLRIYFRCEQGSIEKALWLRAFAAFGRLSSEYRRQRGIINSLNAPLQLGKSRARVRSRENSLLARDTRNLDLSDRGEEKETYVQSVERLVLGNSNALKDREFRVAPTYAYRYRWMTRAEMLDEMLVTSQHFHDLRVPGCMDKEIGALRVEVLQCLGLPKFDRAHDTNGVVYLVSGAYSFVTDVIPNCRNPMWLRKSRRACEIPIFHGYASLYVGVFSDEPKKLKDEFAGRVEINLSKLRPKSVYDVTLPLRLSTHVYSRRKRGAIRLRISLIWHSERDALLSYIPKKIHIPLPQNSLPDYSTTVRCTDLKAFRNVALTVHGAHLPERFTFERLRAVIREINFTRKYIFTELRTSLRALRQWQYPSVSAYVFISWMHCIYANKFSLVPAYVVLFFFSFLMCNYVRYNTDEPAQRGFIPPSWEEMFRALIMGGKPGQTAIEPLELVPRKTKMRKSPNSSSTEKPVHCRISTHKPLGKSIVKVLGLMPTKPRTADEEHLEFCFANGTEYPPFTIKECLIHRKTDVEDPNVPFDIVRDRTGSQDTPNTNTTPTLNPIARLREVDIQGRLKTDTSGTQEFDEEEMNFKATSVVLAKGKKAKSKIFKTASAIKEKTGLNALNVSRVNYMSNSSVCSVKTGDGGTMSTSSGSKFGSFRNNIRGSHLSSSIRRSSNDSKLVDIGSDDEYADDGHESLDYVPSTASGGTNSYLRHSLHREYQHGISEESDDDIRMKDSTDEVDHNLVFPDQDIDVEGPKNGKALTDDLAEIQDKMHELTWHLFDDHTYIIKNANTVFFGDSKKPEKWRKTDVKKQLDKSLAVGQYSYSNPFVSRVGMYVEPIIGSAYSFLCLFRAGFNLLTWRDPMMTFWLSLASGILCIILFVFPWRIFLFVVGLLFVGPQNWIIRIMREKGKLPPVPEYQSINKQQLFTENIVELPIDAPILTADDRKPGNEPTRYLRSVNDDPREIHHIVVPYSPLIYNRCYDWPPEPQYAHVKKIPSIEERYKQLQQQQQSSSRSLLGGAHHHHNQNGNDVLSRFDSFAGASTVSTTRSVGGLFHRRTKQHNIHHNNNHTTTTINPTTVIANTAAADRTIGPTSMTTTTPATEVVAMEQRPNLRRAQSETIVPRLSRETSMISRRKNK